MPNIEEAQTDFKQLKNDCYSQKNYSSVNTQSNFNTTNLQRSLNKNKTQKDLINPKVDYGCYDSVIKETLFSKLPKNQSYVRPKFIEESVTVDIRDKVPGSIKKQKDKEKKKNAADEKPVAPVDIGPYNIKFEKCKNPD